MRRLWCVLRGIYGESFTVKVKRSQVLSRRARRSARLAAAVMEHEKDRISEEVTRAVTEALIFGTSYTRPKGKS